MASAGEYRRKREDILVGLYEATAAGAHDTTVKDIAEAARAEIDEVLSALRLFNEQGWGRVLTFGSDDAAAEIDAAGVYEAERILSEREGGRSLTDTLTVAEFRALEPIVLDLAQLASSPEADELESEDLADLEAQIATLQAQLHSPRPNRYVLRAAMASLGRIGEQAVGSALGGGIIAAVAAALQVLS